MTLKIQIKKLTSNKDFVMPYHATAGSAGMDVCAAINEPILIKPSKIQLIPTGLAVSLPIGFEMQVRPRSGMALKHGVTILNSPGTIDSDYRGEIKIMLINHSDIEFLVENNMRIAQLVVARYEQVSWELVEHLSETNRDINGFGSTGL